MVTNAYRMEDTYAKHTWCLVSPKKTCNSCAYCVPEIVQINAVQVQGCVVVLVRHNISIKWYLSLKYLFVACFCQLSRIWFL